MMIIGFAEKYQKLSNSMENARQLTPEEQSVRIKREMFQGNNLSPLLFMSALIPMLLVLREVKKDISWEIYRLYNQNKK